ncbi:MAG: hypothetical protein BWY99_02365 [Synergistetes bacterium ADurb.BinA166]|nr:MAG: hypothetical protein BWY99_02365 [Synergistetes bacterium ADurb.BinA166]
MPRLICRLSTFTVISSVTVMEESWRTSALDEYSRIRSSAPEKDGNSRSDNSEKSSAARLMTVATGQRNETSGLARSPSSASK